MAEQDRSGEQIGDYRLARKLGEGAFGEVYEAEQVYLGTKAAIKLLQAKLDQHELQSFLAEARKIAALEHPYIVRVLGFSIQGRTPFLVMQLAQGSLKERFPFGQRQPIARILPVIQQAAEGLQHAHDQRVLHLDVKPANLLLAPQGQVLLADFGLSLVLQTQRTHQTMQGFAGTPAYSAPEQFQNKPGLASDQYALATMVYHWLTGVFPFEGDWFAIGHQKLTQDPPPLRARLSSIPPAVEQAVLRALAREPRDRFPTIRDFAEALSQAIQPPSPQQPLRPAMQKPLSAIKMLERLAGLHSNELSLHPTPRSAAQDSMGLTTCKGHTRSVRSVAWAPDGRRLASASDDKTVRLWDAASGKFLTTYQGHTGPVRSVAWAPDSSRLVSGSQDQTVQIWEAATGHHLLSPTKYAGDVLAVAWSPKEQRLVWASLDRRPQFWEKDNRITPWNYAVEPPVYAIAWSPDGKYIALADAVGSIHVRGAKSATKRLAYHSSSGAIYAVAWSPDGSCIASGGAGKTVQLWDAASGRHLHTYEGHTSGVHAVAWAPDGTRLASAGNDGTVRIWDAGSLRCLFTYQGHTGSVNAVAWSSDGTRLASAGGDKTVHIWSAG